MVKRERQRVRDQDTAEDWAAQIGAGGDEDGDTHVNNNIDPAKHVMLIFY